MMDNRVVKVLVVLALVLAAVAVLAAGYKPINPDQAQVSLGASPYLVHPSADKISISASTTVASALGTALPQDTIGVLVVNLSSTASIYMTFDGTAADATNFEIPKGVSVPFYGNKGRVADFRLFAALATDVDLAILELY